MRTYLSRIAIIALAACTLAHGQETLAATPRGPDLKDDIQWGQLLNLESRQ